MKIKSPKFRIREIILGICMLISALILAVAISEIATNKNVEAPATKTEVKPKVVNIESFSTNLMFTGNIFVSRYINDWSMVSPLKYAYPFSRLNEFNRDSYNAWIAGLECPMKSNFQQTSAEEDETLSFNCSPNYLPELKKWFNIVTLANNHTDNQGAEGFDETRHNLDSANIQYFGHYDPRIIEDVCDVVSMPVDVFYDDRSKKKGNIPVAMCGWNGVFRIPPNDSAEIMQKFANFMPVIAMPHMGKEYVDSPDGIKTKFYHDLIDNGADMVLGDHPHWVQPSESYKGHLIVYSMGNFMFDQQFSTEVTRSAAIRAVIDNDSNDKALIQKWLDIGDTCATFKDSCLQKAIDQNLDKLKLTYKFAVIGSDDSGKITHPASQTLQNSILQRLNWSNTMSKLEKPYQQL